MSVEDLGVKEMSYRDENGNVYRLAYSTKIQMSIEDNLKKNNTLLERAERNLRANNWLLWTAILVLIMCLATLALILFGTGIVGNYLSRAICPV